MKTLLKPELAGTMCKHLTMEYRCSFTEETQEKRTWRGVETVRVLKDKKMKLGWACSCPKILSKWSDSVKDPGNEAPNRADVPDLSLCRACPFWETEK